MAWGNLTADHTEYTDVFYVSQPCSAVRSVVRYFVPRARFPKAETGRLSQKACEKLTTGGAIAAQKLREKALPTAEAS
jgi:hypothetical protein